MTSLKKIEDTELSDIIAKRALTHYFEYLPKKGKPKPGSEWTVYAAIVCTRRIKDEKASSEETCPLVASVVSCATGSKCTPVSTMSSSLSKDDTLQYVNHLGPQGEKEYSSDQIKGMILHDSHAEILARRGLCRVLWEEIQHDLTLGEDAEQETDSNLLIRKKHSNNGLSPSSNQISYELNPSVQLHLYISDSPCGDASIYDLSPEYIANNSSNDSANFTGAKIITSLEKARGVKSCDPNLTLCGRINNGTNEESNSCCIARERHQKTSALRLKSGRSNIPAHMRSSSMSCSDKICKWIILGIQGSGILTSFLNSPIYLTSIVVSRDLRVARNEHGKSSQMDSLERALIERAKRAKEIISTTSTYSRRKYDSIIPDIFITDHIFPQGKAVSDKEKYDLSVKSQHGVMKCNENSPRKKRKVSDNTTSCSVSERSSSSPIGMSINWQKSDILQKVRVELTIGAKGMKQGRKPKKLQDLVNSSSRLSRIHLFQLALNCLQLLQERSMKLLRACDSSAYHPGVSTRSYQMSKNLLCDVELKELKKMLFSESASPLLGWVRNAEEHDFKFRSVCSSCDPSKLSERKT